jgi:nucleotide-binding universal stress UspA family protein
MNQHMERQPSRIVLVVGLDLSEISEHLLVKARDLVTTAERAEVHVVHVVRPEPLRERLGEPIHSEAGPGTRALKESAQWELERLCRKVLEPSPVRFVVHVRVGRTAPELAQVAKEVGADFVVVEAHDREGLHRIFHRSVVASIARDAPCSVLTIRHLDEGAHPDDRPVRATALARA